jgi:long-chain acyl-CoA synthetase
MSQIKFEGSDKVHNLKEVIPHFSLPFEETDGSTAVPGTETKEFSPIFRNKYLKGEEPAAVLHPSLSTFYDVFEQSVGIHANNKSVGYRERKKGSQEFNDYYTWETYDQLAEKRTWAGSAFLHLVEKYAADSKDDFILTLFSANKPEWIISDLASHAYSIPNTPLYDTLGVEATEYILKLTESPIIVLSKAKISKVFDVKSPFLKVLVSIEDVSDDEEIALQAKEKGYHLIDFKELLRIGKENQRPHIPPTPDTLYTISFTSGTTGVPKGVQLNHSHICAALLFLLVHVKFPNNPTSLVFLPLAHVYERFKIVYELAEGGAIGFPHNPENPTTFLQDIKILKPTHISSVPRLYTRIESGLKEKVKNTPGFKGWLLRYAINHKLTTNEDEENPGYLTSVLNKLVINKIKQQLGFENLDFLITGGSPLAAESINYLRKALNCGFYQGYGSSETFGGICITTRVAKDPTRTGAIGVSAEFKLRNLPDLNYSYKDNKSGELLLRGPQIFKSYFKNEEATKSAVSEDGWFSTGDIAQIDNEGRIAIIDRVKNFFKLAQGEYIASEKIENFYLSNNSFISQLFVYGNSFQSYLVGIIGIEPELLLKYISKKNSDVTTHEQLLLKLNDLDFRKFILQELNDNIKETGLFSFEKLKNIHIAIEPFKISDDTITPTLKLKRNKAQKFFQKEIDAMYSEGTL